VVLDADEIEVTTAAPQGAYEVVVRVLVGREAEHPLRDGPLALAKALTEPCRRKAPLVLAPDGFRVVSARPQVLIHVALSPQDEAENRVDVAERQRRVLLNDLFGRRTLAEPRHDRVERDTRARHPDHAVRTGDEREWFVDKGEGHR